MILIVIKSNDKLEGYANVTSDILQSINNKNKEKEK